jgi:hypothetical protein
MREFRDYQPSLANNSGSWLVNLSNRNRNYSIETISASILGCEEGSVPEVSAEVCADARREVLADLLVL